jgi:hypothetical protein
LGLQPSGLVRVILMADMTQGQIALACGIPSDLYHAQLGTQDQKCE